jgi:hypothetical protein
VFASAVFEAGYDDGLSLGAEVPTGAELPTAVEVAVEALDVGVLVGLAAGVLLEAEVGDGVVPPPAGASGAADGDDGVVRAGAAFSSGAPQPARAKAATPNSARVRLRNIKV